MAKRQGWGSGECNSTRRPEVGQPGTFMHGMLMSARSWMTASVSGIVNLVNGQIHTSLLDVLNVHTIKSVKLM